MIGLFLKDEDRSESFLQIIMLINLQIYVFFFMNDCEIVKAGKLIKLIFGVETMKDIQTKFGLF